MNSRTPTNAQAPSQKLGTDRPNVFPREHFSARDCFPACVFPLYCFPAQEQPPGRRAGRFAQAQACRVVGRRALDDDGGSLMWGGAKQPTFPLDPSKNSLSGYEPMGYQSIECQSKAPPAHHPRPQRMAYIPETPTEKIKPVKHQQHNKTAQRNRTTKQSPTPAGQGLHFPSRDFSRPNFLHPDCFPARSFSLAG